MRSFLIFLFLATMPIASYAQCSISNVKNFAEIVATEHKNGTLENIDKIYPGKVKFQVKIENSIAEDVPADQIDVNNFTELAQWLKNRQVEGFPAPYIRKLLYCKKGLCLFDFFEGIHHRALYLHSINYKGISSCSELIAIQFLDGN